MSSSRAAVGTCHEKAQVVTSRAVSDESEITAMFFSQVAGRGICTGVALVSNRAVAAYSVHFVKPESSM